jgi:sugar phosphate permease
MLDLDVRSVILISGILSLLMAVVLFFLRRNYPSATCSC